MSIVTLDNHTCPNCGGDFILSVNSQYAQCENCGNTASVDTEELAKIRKIYRSAERQMHLNSAAGYNEAVNILQPISFVSEAREKLDYCDKRLSELKLAQSRKAEAKEQSDKKDTAIGIIFVVLLLLVVALAIAGAIYIIYHLRAGDLSPTAITVIISVVAVLAVLMIISKIKS